MNVFNRLIGTKVEIYCLVDEDYFKIKGAKKKGDGSFGIQLFIILEAEIIDYNIDDYYFYEKQEPIYITVNCKPIGEIPIGFDLGDYEEITLDLIRYYGK